MHCRVGIPGGYGEGNTGYYPASCCEEDPPDSDRRERALGPAQGGPEAGSGDCGEAAGTGIPTLRARSVRPRPALPGIPLECRLLANKGEIQPHILET